MKEENADFKSLLGRMARLCSRREYCSADILGKLRKSGMEGKDAERILQRLKEDGYVDDSRYASAFARDKAQISGWGPKKIAFALKNKGLSRSLIENAIAESADNPQTYGRMKSVIGNKWKSLSGEESAKRQAKTLRYALGRGYGYEEAMRVIRELSGLLSL